MTTSIKHGWLTEHRGWEDFCSAGCGLLIVLSPILGTGDAVAAVSISAGLAGVLITMLALLEVMQLQRWEEVLEFACGLWVVVSPLVFGYGGTLRLAHFLLGATVAALALLELWQDRKRRLEG
ncbi:SPW repeat protein [Pelagibius sp. CAU 1746]|uniref:SPW repeat domain-containing protein n=1 Tax=Pelagibius sp. CAU 1746 TaxID=3140370 RepID=UPI00325B15DD